jgi:hypothetical protein
MSPCANHLAVDLGDGEAGERHVADFTEMVLNQ